MSSNNINNTRIKTRNKGKNKKRKSPNSGPSGNKRQRISSDDSEIGETKESEVLIEKFDDGRLLEKTIDDITAKTGNIYIITNIITLLSYIGLTIREVEIRWQEHEYSGKNNPKYYFGRAIAKYGWENFKCETLAENVPIEELAELEIYYIKEYDTFNNGYNSTIGGEGTFGYIWTEEQLITKSKASTTTHDYIEGGGSISYVKDRDKWVVMGSAMSGGEHIGSYFTIEKAIAALKLYNRTKVCMESDIRINRSGCVSYHKNRKKWMAKGPKTSSGKAPYIGQYLTKEMAFESLDHYKKTGKCRGSDMTHRKRGTGSVYYDNTVKKWIALGPQTTSVRQAIGRYDTEKRAIEANARFITTGECLDSDRTIGKKGTGTIIERNGRYSGKIIIDKVPYLTKTYGSRQQAEEDLKNLILAVDNGTYIPPKRGRTCYIWEIGKEDAKKEYGTATAAADAMGLSHSTAVARIIKNNKHKKWRGEYIE